MNKTLNINLAGYIFHVDEDAFIKLERYLNTLKAQFVKTEGGREIISDIEMRVAELFKERTGENKEVINLADVEQVIEIMGQPEDYLEMDDEAPKQAPELEFTSRRKRIFRDGDNRILGGVAAGLAAYFNMDTIWMRVIFLFLLFFSGFGLLVYFIMWLIIPKAQTTAEKLQMRGEKVNISNIEKAIRDEMKGINENVKGFGNKVSSFDYKKPSNQLSSFFSDLGNFLVDAVKLIFKILGKLIGLVFLFLGFMILIALIIGLFAGGVQILGSGYDFGDLFDFLELVSVSNGHYNLLLAGIIMSIIAPFFLLVYLGMRLLFNLEPLNSAARSTLVLTTFIGLVFMLVSGIKIGLQFDDRSQVSTELALPNARNFTIKVQPDELTERYMDNYAPNWIHEDDLNAFDQVEVDIYKAEGNEPYFELVVSAFGHSRREARINARDIKYNVEIQDSTILLPYYYLLQKGHKFRDQSVRAILYLPEGHSVFIDKSINEMLSDADNVQNRWDYEMGGERWIMTAGGLSCEGCPIPDRRETDETDEEDDHMEIRGDSFELDINEDGVRMKIKEKDSVKANLQLSCREERSLIYTIPLLPFKNDLGAII